MIKYSFKVKDNGTYSNFYFNETFEKWTQSLKKN